MRDLLRETPTAAHAMSKTAYETLQQDGSACRHHLVRSAISLCGPKGRLGFSAAVHGSGGQSFAVSPKSELAQRAGSSLGAPLSVGGGARQQF